MRSYTDIDEENERLVVTFVGDMTLYDIHEMTSTSGKAGMLNFTLLCDAEQARMSLQEDEKVRFRELVRNLASRSRLGRTAVLVAREADLPVIDVLTEGAAGYCEVQGFTDREEAERWLGWVPAHVQR